MRNRFVKVNLEKKILTKVSHCTHSLTFWLPLVIILLTVSVIRPLLKKNIYTENTGSLYLPVINLVFTFFL